MRTLAETLAGLGALAVLTMCGNLVALRAVCPDEVPVCVRPRILWWSAHTLTVLRIAAVVTLLGLAGLVAT